MGMLKLNAVFWGEVRFLYEQIVCSVDEMLFLEMLFPEVLFS